MHRLAVILHADVVDSTRLVRTHERLAHERIRAAFQVFSGAVDAYGGVTNEIRGDAMVAEFSRASDALLAAVAAQQKNHQRNKTFDDEIVPRLRVGIALGEVVVADDIMTGAGVVLAQRLEQLAEPDGICISGAVREAVPDRLPIDYRSLGSQRVKGFDEPVHALAVLLRAGEAVPAPEVSMQARPRSARRAGIRFASAMAILLLTAAALGAWWLLPLNEAVKAARPEKMALALPDRPSIAVVPFDNLGGDEAKSELVDGLTGTLIGALAATPRLFVIAGGSTKRYQGKNIEPRLVAEEQGVRYVLGGNVQWSGDKLRVNVQLIDAIEGAYLWSERYDRRIEDIFKVQDDIVKNILAKVEGKLVWAHGPEIWAGMTKNLDAYLHYLNGQKALFRFSPDYNLVAREHATKAIESDPGYASGWNLLGWTYYHDGRKGWANMSQADAWATASKHARKAIELAPRYGSPRGMLAQIASRQGQYEEALAICDEAVKLAPNEAILLAICASVNDEAGKHHPAVDLTGKALRLSPFPPAWFIMSKGRAHFFIGDYETTIGLFMNRQWPDSLSPRVAESFLAAALHAAGRTDEAADSVARLLAIDPTITAHRVTVDIPSRYEPKTRQQLIDAYIAAGIPAGTPPTAQ